MSWRVIAWPVARSSGLSVGAFGSSSLEKFAMEYPRARDISDAMALSLSSDREKLLNVLVIDNLTDHAVSKTDEFERFLNSRTGVPCMVLVVGRRRWSFSRFRANVLSNRRVTKGLSLSRIKYALTVSGFQNFELFDAVPHAVMPEEFRSAKLPFGDQVKISDRLRVIFDTATRRRLRGRDYILIAGRDCAPFTVLRLAVQQISKVRKPSFAIDRFSIRDRGKSVFSGRLLCSGQEVILKVVEDEGAAEAATRTTRFTKQLEALDCLDEKWRALIPESLAVVQQDDMTVFVEQQLPGILGWQLTDRRLKVRRLINSAMQFSLALGVSTEQRITIDNDVFNDLIGNDLKTLRGLPKTAILTKDIIDSISVFLQSHLVRRKYSVVWGHGDFGLGNILCEKKTGCITGIIDWDTYSTREFPVIDTLNLLIQQRTTRQLMPRLMNLVESKSAGAILLTTHLKQCLEHFEMVSEDYRFYLGIGVLRSIARDQRYTGLALSDDQCNAIRYSASLLEDSIRAT